MSAGQAGFRQWSRSGTLDAGDTGEANVLVQPCGHIEWYTSWGKPGTSYRYSARSISGSSLVIASSYAGTGVITSRDRPTTRRADSEWMVVYAPLAGSVDVASRRGEIRLRPGQFGVMPTTEPVDVRISGRARTLTAFLPCGSLEGIGPAAAAPVARALPANPAYQLFAQHLRLTLQLGPSLDGHACIAAASAASQLLAAAFTSADAQAAPCHDVVRIAQLKDYIDGSLANPSLSAAQVAAANFVSERTVQRLFHATDETPSDYIRRRRLENCRADILANPALPIGEICLRWGLPDGSHLARQFRAQFGASPQQIRALAGTETKRGATDVRPTG